MRPKKRMELQLQNAYQADGSCYYCGVCLVDGPSPDFEVAYLAVVLS
ncbi:MAG: subtilosin A family bacteriocin [Bryobacterales bacterium]|nr:subtilosin A family bacteriocin [Bryobacterales bacterium]